MNSQQPQIDALRALGYSEQESRFLYLVATHSGYFVARQFLGFAGARSRRRASLLWAKLQARQHARICRLAQSGTVYHLFSRKIYRQIGHENLPNRREHEFEYIRTRIAGLDFVLGNLDNQYLEAEPDKLAYFCSELNVPTHHLPAKSYADRHTEGAVVRYFADRYPMFIPALPYHAPSSSPICRAPKRVSRDSLIICARTCLFFGSLPSSNFYSWRAPIVSSAKRMNCSAIWLPFRLSRILRMICCATSGFARLGTSRSTLL